MAVTRRIIWLSDQEWADLDAIAKYEKRTISQVIRDMIYEPIRGQRVIAESMGPKGVPMPEFRPVPKPGKTR